MRQPALWRWIWWMTWLGGVLWFVRATIVPATIHAVRLAEVGGNTPYLARMRWRYGRGARPLSLIIDVVAGAMGGSVTVDGDEDEAVIPLAHAPHGPYTVTLQATYRVLGVVWVRVIRVHDQF